MQNAMHKYFHWGAIGSLGLLIVWCVLWEMVLAPLKPGGSWLVLKAAPLLLPLYGVWKRDIYTLQWTSMMILLYFTEGVVRAWSDTSGMSQLLALAEVLLCLSLFTACAWHVRLRLRNAAATRTLQIPVP